MVKFVLIAFSVQIPNHSHKKQEMCHNVTNAPKDKDISRTEARGQGHSDSKTVCDTPQWCYPKMYSYTKFGIHKQRTGVKVKITVTQKQYVTLHDPKVYPHTKYGIPTSKNIGDMLRTRFSRIEVKVTVSQ